MHKREEIERAVSLQGNIDNIVPISSAAPGSDLEILDI